MSSPQICVVGSANLDLNTYTNRLPVPGETLHAHRFTMGYGGKGANQAVAAARLGADVALVARVGSDLFGRDMIAHLRNERIDTRYVTFTDGVPTGTAVITVDDAGRNTIAVTPGANGVFTPADVDAARALIESARVLVCQQEVPTEANLAAIRIAAAGGVPVVFNPAPAGTVMPAEVYRLSTVFCPNEHEAAVLTGKPVGAREEAEIAARELMARGAQNVIVTLGARGCLVVTARDVTALPAPAVEAVDTTGAGDAFIGSLAFFLARGDDLVTAAQRANRVAAISVRSPGTQTSFPRAADLPVDLL